MYPVLFASESARQLPIELAQFGCKAGVKAMTEILLDYLEKKGSNTSIKIHKRMDIFKDGVRKFRLDEQITKPGDKFNVESSNDYDQTFWIVSLKDTKSVRHRTIKRKSVKDDDDETAYQKQRRTENLFLSPFSLAIQQKQN